MKPFLPMMFLAVIGCAKTPSSAPVAVVLDPPSPTVIVETKTVAEPPPPKPAQAEPAPPMPPGKYLATMEADLPKNSRWARGHVDVPPGQTHPVAPFLAMPHLGGQQLGIFMAGIQPAKKSNAIEELQGMVDELKKEHPEVIVSKIVSPDKGKTSARLTFEIPETPKTPALKGSAHLLTLKGAGPDTWTVVYFHGLAELDGELSKDVAAITKTLRIVKVEETPSQP